MLSVRFGSVRQDPFNLSEAIVRGTGSRFDPKRLMIDNLHPERLRRQGAHDNPFAPRDPYRKASSAFAATKRAIVCFTCVRMSPRTSSRLSPINALMSIGETIASRIWVARARECRLAWARAWGSSARPECSAIMVATASIARDLPASLVSFASVGNRGASATTILISPITSSLSKRVTSVCVTDTSRGASAADCGVSNTSRRLRSQFRVTTAENNASLPL